jgi:hypothetical protein
LLRQHSIFQIIDADEDKNFSFSLDAFIHDGFDFYDGTYLPYVRIKYLNNNTQLGQVYINADTDKVGEVQTLALDAKTPVDCDKIEIRIGGVGKGVVEFDNVVFFYDGEVDNKMTNGGFEEEDGTDSWTNFTYSSWSIHSNKKAKLGAYESISQSIKDSFVNPQPTNKIEFDLSFNYRFKEISKTTFEEGFIKVEIKDIDGKFTKEYSYPYPDNNSTIHVFKTIPLENINLPSKVKITITNDNNEDILIDNVELGPDMYNEYHKAYVALEPMGTLNWNWPDASENDHMGIMNWISEKHAEAEGKVIHFLHDEIFGFGTDKITLPAYGGQWKFNRNPLRQVNFSHDPNLASSDILFWIYDYYDKYEWKQNAYKSFELMDDSRNHAHIYSSSRALLSIDDSHTGEKWLALNGHTFGGNSNDKTETWEFREMASYAYNAGIRNIGWWKFLHPEVNEDVQSDGDRETLKAISAQLQNLKPKIMPISMSTFKLYANEFVRSGIDEKYPGMWDRPLNGGAANLYDPYVGKDDMFILPLNQGFGFEDYNVSTSNGIVILNDSDPHTRTGDYYVLPLDDVNTDVSNVFTWDKKLSESFSFTNSNRSYTSYNRSSIGKRFKGESRWSYAGFDIPLDINYTTNPFKDGGTFSIDLWLLDGETINNTNDENIVERVFLRLVDEQGEFYEWRADASTNFQQLNNFRYHFRFGYNNLTGEKTQSELLKYNKSSSPNFDFSKIKVLHVFVSTSVLDVESTFIIDNLRFYSDGLMPNVVNFTSEAVLGKAFEIEALYPNPFNPSITMRYYLPKPSKVKIDIYDISGRLVRNLYNGVQNDGSNTISWSGKNSHGNLVSSGVYFVIFNHGEKRLYRKIILMK